jgi:transposase-like protein
MHMECNCRCINCKSPSLTSNDFVASDGYEDSHHTCKVCGVHFNHLDGEQFKHCDICAHYPSIEK